MAVGRWYELGRRLPGAVGARSLAVARDEWRQVAEDVAASGGQLLALWAGGGIGNGPVVHAAFSIERGLLVVDHEVAAPNDRYPGIEGVFPAASRMQRAAADLSGLRSTDPDERSWLRHAAWPGDFHPLRDDDKRQSDSPPAVDVYPFVRVEGDGVHEIPVGPVHAGIIEPGHFRFSVVGEKVLRLEERLGYVHKGIERRFTEMPIQEGYRLAARISGDSTAAFSWAYCQAFEGLTDADLPPRAPWMRALCLELERIANHLGDLGALGNDAGFAFGLAQLSRLKEELLRITEQGLGHRYLFDAIVPGGTSVDLVHGGASGIRRFLRHVDVEVDRIRNIYDEHEGVRDRFVGAGRVPPELAARLGLVGLAGRASGQAADLRVDLPTTPYGVVVPTKCGYTDGDVAARVAMRFDEVRDSCRLVQELLDGMPAGKCLDSVGTPSNGARGIGAVEGWRGPVLVALEAGADGRIRRCHPHDPSWQNWPVLEHAIIGNIVPDFPLINKSFNLSYSGHDL